MNLRRNDTLTAVVTERLRNARIGLVVYGITGIDVAKVSAAVAKNLQAQLHVASIGYKVATQPASITFSEQIEDAVSWRHTPQLAGHIIVFVQNQVPKLHSLNDLDRISSRDLANQLIVEARLNLADNQPQQRFWEALRVEASAFPLKMLEDFVKAIDSERKDLYAISSNLWRLGLLRDDDLLNSNQKPEARLRDNRRLILEMNQLSGTSRQRMNLALSRSSGKRQSQLREAYLNLMDLHRRGDINVLKNLTFQIVSDLIQVAHSTTTDTSQTINPEQGEPEQSTRALRGRALQQAVSYDLVSSEAEAQERLNDLIEPLREFIRDPQHSVENLSLKGQPILPDKPVAPLRDLINLACTRDSWGGVLETNRNDVKEAVRAATAEDFTAYDPNNPEHGAGGQSLFSLLRQLDTYLPEPVFSESLTRLESARSKLLETLDLILFYPLIAFGGDVVARTALDEYLTAYTDLLRNFTSNEATLHGKDPAAARYVAAQLLRLDVIYLRTPTEWKAVLSPLHGIHLWRFREVLKTAHGSILLTAEQQTQLAEALPDLPHLLHYVVISPDVTNGEMVVLPQSGALELLPTFENKTNRYLGIDGISFLQDLLGRWYQDSPYARRQIRLALLNVPDLPEAIRIAAEFLKRYPTVNSVQTESAMPTTLLIDAYFMRGQNPSGQLARMDFDDRDYEVTELIRSRRLLFNTYTRDSSESIVEDLVRNPVHLAYVFDQSDYKVDYGPRAHHLTVSPLVITYEYEYSDAFKRGTIVPSSEAEEGLFSYYHFLIIRAANLPAGQQIRATYGDDKNVQPINTILQREGARWLAVADRMVGSYRPDEAVPLGELKIGQREVAVWASKSSQSVKRFLDLLRRYNLRPDEEHVANLLRQHGHIATSGLLGLPIGGNSSARDSREKGLLGTVLAAVWYANQYPGALVASLDTPLARQWLQARSNSEQRADLIGLRFEGGILYIEPIEVKTRAGNADIETEVVAATGHRKLKGEAVEQLKSTLEILPPVFGSPDDSLFTRSRREVLKYQLYRECFREIHEPEWRRIWSQRLKDAFSQTPSLSPQFCGLVVHVRLEENDESITVEDQTQPFRLVRLGTKAIQRLIAPLDTEEIVLDNDEQHSSSLEMSLLTTDTTPKGVGQLDSAVDTSRTLAPSSPVPAPEINVPSAPTPTPPPANVLDEVEDLARLFRRACQAYRIGLEECDPARAVIGPNVIRFYIRLSRGQRLDPLRAVLEDIGREMSRSGLLIARPPHSNDIALDVPRISSQKVLIGRVLPSLAISPSPEQMLIPIGVTPEGSDIVRDLGKMPHILVGGTTGSGKTVFLQGLILALLKTHPNPSSLRILVSSSKPEDFVFFEGVPHLETGRVVSDAVEAIRLLQTQIQQVFDDRLSQFQQSRCASIEQYNAKNSPLPPYVVIVDEFADLADQLSSNRVAREAFYSSIRRIAQSGRSRGFHLVLCTQRPSADLVPTSIRTLLNARVALRVNDSTASRMILDDNGAEQLQYRGDLLFKDTESAQIIRAQGYWVPPDELNDFVISLPITS